MAYRRPWRTLCVLALHFLLGGGLPVGSLLLIEEDYSGNYAKLLLKYFLGK